MASVKVTRYNVDTHSSLGILTINGVFKCYILESTKHIIKEGKYKLGLRTEGGMHQDFKERYKGIHKGMIEIKNVKWDDGKERFYLQFHPGNSIADTKGCPLIGDGVNNNHTSNGFLSNSVRAYTRVYPELLKLVENEDTFITFENL